MKTVLLAGVFGSRISEESAFKPKSMIEIGCKPILWRIMKEYAYYGHTEFVVQYGAIPVFVDMNIPEYSIDVSKLVVATK